MCVCVLNHIKNFEKVKGLIENKINNYIGSTKVESLEDEENLCITFSIVTSYSYMYKLSEHIQRKVRCFYNFLSSHPYKFLRIPYQFNNNNNNYDKLLRICFLYDLDKIAFELIRLFFSELFFFISVFESFHCLFIYIKKNKNKISVYKNDDL